MNIQRLRNLTTGYLHTNIHDVMQDIEYLVGVDGLFTHQIPNAYTALLPWLKTKVKDDRFWEEVYDTSHMGEFEISPMTKEEKQEYWQRFSVLPSPLTDKKVVMVTNSL